MKVRHYVPLSLGLAGAGLVVMSALGSVTAGAAVRSIPEDQGFRVQNLTGDNSGQDITVRLLHSDGSLQAQKTLKPGDTHRFTFNWCSDCCGHDKHRKFEVKTGSTVRATGELNMTTKKDGLDCDERNEMTVVDQDPDDIWTFHTDYTSGHRTAILNVRNKLFVKD